MVGSLAVVFSFNFVSFSPLGRSTFVRPFFFLFFPSARAVKIKTGEFEADIYASSCNRILWPDNF